METAWELRPDTDETPGTKSHHNRFAKPMSKGEKESKTSKTKEKGR